MEKWFRPTNQSITGEAGAVGLWFQPPSREKEKENRRGAEGAGGGGSARRGDWSIDHWEERSPRRGSEPSQKAAARKKKGLCGSVVGFAGELGSWPGGSRILVRGEETINISIERGWEGKPVVVAHSRPKTYS